MAEHNHLVNLIRFVDGLISTEDFKKSLADLISHPCIKHRRNSYN